MQIILEHGEYEVFKREIETIETITKESLTPLIDDITEIIDVVDVDNGDVSIIIDPLLTKTAIGTIGGLLLSTRAFGHTYKRYCKPKFKQFDNIIELIRSERKTNFDQYDVIIDNDDFKNESSLFSKYMSKLFKLMCKESNKEDETK